MCEDLVCGVKSDRSRSKNSANFNDRVDTWFRTVEAQATKLVG